MTRRGWFALAALALVACDRPSSPRPASDAPGASSSQPSADDGGGHGGPRTATAAPTSIAEAGTPPAGTSRFDGETVGAPSSAFEAVVGDWSVARVDGATGLKVDGSRWRDGTPSANLADQAKRLYGDRYAEFLDGVKAFAFYPLAIAKEPPPPGDLKLSMRFYPVAGKIDQAAGFAFGIAPDGGYLGVRANALEDNLLFFEVVKGKRKIIDTIRNVPTPTRTWHTLVLEIRGKQLTTWLDGTKRFEKTLDAPPRGRVGLWSKADSQVMFDDVEVSMLGEAFSGGRPALTPEE